MRRRFDSDYLRREFDRLGSALSTSTDTYLIGGGSMAFRDLKEATKDIDLVVTNRVSLNRLSDALETIGYRVVHDPGDEYASLGAQSVLENDDGCRFDIFVRQVGGELEFSDGMQRRSEAFVTAGQLTVHLVSPEDVFLFKSVAGRTDDIEDMTTLVQTGLDFEAIEREINRQVALLGEEFFVTVVNESLVELEDRFGVTVPIRDAVAKRTNRVYSELEVLLAFDDSTTIESLTDEVDITAEELDPLLTGLERKGVIERTGSGIEKLRERP